MTKYISTGEEWAPGAFANARMMFCSSPSPEWFEALPDGTEVCFILIAMLGMGVRIQSCVISEEQRAQVRGMSQEEWDALGQIVIYSLPPGESIPDSVPDDLIEES